MKTTGKLQPKQLNNAAGCDMILKLRNFKKETFKRNTDKQNNY
jgi:hypothetical protein